MQLQRELTDFNDKLLVIYEMQPIAFEKLNLA